MKNIKKISDLSPDKKNANKGTALGQTMVDQSIGRYGAGRSIVADKHGNVIGGNKTLKSAIEAGLEVEVVRSSGDKLIVHQREDLDLYEGDEARMLAYADNRSSEVGLQWDADQLGDDIADGLDLGDMFSEKELDGIGVEYDKPELVEPEAQMDAAEELQKKWKVKDGDIWEIGEHRLMCGDCTKENDTMVISNESNIDICFTSPPYALGKSISLSGNKKMSQGESPYIGHKDIDLEWRDLMDGWYKNARNIVNDCVIANVQPLAGNKRDLFSWIYDNIERLIDVATWDKGHAAPVIAQGVMSSCFEWIVLFGDNDAKRSIPYSSWRGNIQSVYHSPGQKNNEYSSIHAATFPLHLPLWVIGTLCDKSTSVYDPFLGTGTTMVACEQLKRKCYGMEIEPKYCAVILERMSEMGLTPELVSNARQA